VWDFLEWMGKHAQAPVTVASKPHYFCELHVVRPAPARGSIMLTPCFLPGVRKSHHGDRIEASSLLPLPLCPQPAGGASLPSAQLRTVRNLVERVPEFWESAELLEEVRTGELLHVDPSYFVSALLDDIGDGREDALRLVESYLEHEDYAVLCRTLLPLLHPPALLCLLDGLLPLAAPTAAAARGVEGLEALVLGGTRWATVDDAMLHSALAVSLRCSLAPPD
jgi:hypothetical protein